MLLSLTAVDTTAKISRPIHLSFAIVQNGYQYGLIFFSPGVVLILRVLTAPSVPAIALTTRLVTFWRKTRCGDSRMGGRTTRREAISLGRLLSAALSCRSFSSLLMRGAQSLGGRKNARMVARKLSWGLKDDHCSVPSHGR